MAEGDTKKERPKKEKKIDLTPLDVTYPDDVNEKDVVGFYPHVRPLVRGTFLKRRDRFIADVKLDACGTEVESHCVNPGRMEGYNDPGSSVWLLPAPEGSDRKCKYTWELLEHRPSDGLLCGVQTSRPNDIMKQLMLSRKIPGLDDWVECRPEKMLPDHIEKEHGRSRIDFWLKHPDGTEHYVEFKNCHMVYEDGFGYFPDSVSERASKHMGALQALKEAGYRATSLFLVVRGDCENGARPSDFHDPTFAKAVRQASAAGVEFRGFRAHCRTDGYLVDTEIPVDVEEYDTTDIARQWEENRPKTGWIRTFNPNANTQVANQPFKHNAPGYWERKEKAEARAKIKKERELEDEKSDAKDVAKTKKVKVSKKAQQKIKKGTKSKAVNKKTTTKPIVKTKAVGAKSKKVVKKVAKGKKKVVAKKTKATVRKAVPARKQKKVIVKKKKKVVKGKRK